MKSLSRFPYFLLVVFLTVLLAAAGCTSPSGTVPAAGGITGPNNCTSITECAAYCSAHQDVCEQYCRDHADVCSRLGSAPGQKPSGPTGQSGQTDFATGTACDTPAVKQKMMTEINKILVTPPDSIRAPNWQTKILPAGNPYPGYYYDLSTAFGPAIDSQKTAWTGVGEPPRVAGLDYYIIGYWDEKPKGISGHMGEKTPDSMDFSQYQLAVFYTNVTGKSQAAMIGALPALTMSESDAKAYFASKIKKSFINLDNKELTRSGNQKMYEVIWHDSDNTQDYWDVQIGVGYIAIGQGKIYSAESQLQGDPGTIWKYHACKPCENCDDWTVEKAFNKDCSRDSDCLAGLSCSAGYCVKPGSGQSQSQQNTGQVTTPGSGSTGGNGPGSACKTSGDCASGLSCTNGACSIPGGKP
jgi:hypothetical protein